VKNVARATKGMKKKYWDIGRTRRTAAATITVSTRRAGGEELYTNTFRRKIPSSPPWDFHDYEQEPLNMAMPRSSSGGRRHAWTKVAGAHSGREIPAVRRGRNL